MCVTSKHLDPLQTSSFDLFCSLSTGMFVRSPPHLPFVAWLWTTQLKLGVGFEGSPRCPWDEPIPASEHTACSVPALLARSPPGVTGLGAGLTNSQLLDSCDGMRVTLPFLGWIKFLVFVVAGRIRVAKKTQKATPDVLLSILKHRRLIWGRTRLLTFRSAWGWQSHRALRGQG